MKKLQENPETLVVGAGSVGLFAAWNLAHSGHNTLLIDQAGERGSFDPGLVLHPWVLERMADAGLLEELMERGRKVETVRTVLDGQGEKEFSLSEISPDLPFLTLPSAAWKTLMQRELVNRGVDIHWATRLASLRQSREITEAKVYRLEKDETGLGSSWYGNVVKEIGFLHPRFVIGCDGIQSLVRLSQDIPLEFCGGLESFAAIAFECDSPSGNSALFYSAGEQRLVLWPFPENRFLALIRIRPELLQGLSTDPAEMMTDLGAPYLILMEEDSVSLLDGFSAVLPRGKRQILDSVIQQITPSYASSFQKGMTVLCGDAAHSAWPAAFLSANLGFREAFCFTHSIHRILQGENSHEELRETATGCFHQAERLMKGRSETDPWRSLGAGEILLPEEDKRGRKAG